MINIEVVAKEKEAKRLEFRAREKALNKRLRAIPKVNDMSPEHLAEVQALREEMTTLLAEMVALNKEPNQ